jgi:hypothetical protein
MMNHLVRRMVSAPPRQTSLFPLASAAAVAGAVLSVSVVALTASSCEEHQQHLHGTGIHAHVEPAYQKYDGKEMLATSSSQNATTTTTIASRPSTGSKNDVITDTSSETSDVKRPKQEGSDDTNNANDDDNEDEPTTCILCLTFRSGPCRSVFLPYERCIKANPSPSHIDDAEDKDEDEANDGEANAVTTSSVDDNTATNNNNNDDDDYDDSDNQGAAPCADEAMPFLECISRNNNIHTLLFLQSYRELYIDPFETQLKEIKHVTPLPWTGIDIDWSELWNYANDHNLTLADFAATPSVDWNQFLSSGEYYRQADPDKDDDAIDTDLGVRDLDDCASDPTCPARDIILGNSVHDEPIHNPLTYTGDINILIPVSARVNLYDDTVHPVGDNNDDTVKGTDVGGNGRFRLHSCYARDQNGRLLGHNDDIETLMQEGATEYKLNLVIHPGETMCIKLYKIYIRGEKEEEARLYVSKSKFLVEAAYEAGLK